MLTQEDSAAGASEGFIESQEPDSAAVSPRSWCFPEDEGGFLLENNGMKAFGLSPPLLLAP